MKHRFIRSPLRALLLCATALLPSVSAPVFAQTTESAFSAVLRGTDTPQTMRASALTSQWRRFSRTGEHSGLTALLEREANLPPVAYFTRGETVSVGAESFLIAYRAVPVAPPLSNTTSEEEILKPMETSALRLKADTVLTLSLLNLRTIGDLNDVQAFETSRDIIDEKEQKRLELLQSAEASETNLKQIGLGLMQYVQDYDEILPPMRSVQSKAEITEPQGKLATVQSVLQPYIKSADVFAHPITRELYQPNMALSGVSLASVENPAQVIAFWEKSPYEGKRAVLYLDGHVKREPIENWPQILAISNRMVPPRARKPKPAMDAAMITPMVKTALGANGALRGANINVDTTDTRVTLSGVVGSAAQKTLAGSIAKKKAPGYNVVNNLKVD